MRILLSLMILLFVATLTSGYRNSAKVAPISLDKLVQSSDYILVGKVEAIESVESVKVAKVKLIRTLKGTPVHEIYYLAQATWICDISGAEPGETALFFLSDYSFAPKPSDFREKVKTLTKGVPLQVLQHAGRGRMSLRSIDGVDYVTVWTMDVILPKTIQTVPGPEPQYDFIRSVSLDTMIAYTEKVISGGDKAVSSFISIILDNSTVGFVYSRSLGANTFHGLLDCHDSEA